MERRSRTPGCRLWEDEEESTKDTEEVRSVKSEENQMSTESWNPSTGGVLRGREWPVALNAGHVR